MTHNFSALPIYSENLTKCFISDSRFISTTLITVFSSTNISPFDEYSEIYRIVSAKTVLSPGEESDVIRPSNLETINVKPTVNTDAVKKQCCNS